MNISPIIALDLVNNKIIIHIMYLKLKIYADLYNIVNDS